MLTEIRLALRPAFVILLLMTILLGLIYPYAITGIAQVIFPSQANGSLIRQGDAIVGSSLIGQNFATARYFHPRPSAAGKGYDASASAASNLAPGSKDLISRVKTDVDGLRTQGLTGVIPTDLVTTSASGLDPHISPEAAFVQIDRVAKARGMTSVDLQARVKAATEYPFLGLIGEPRVNVLLLNRQLDALSANQVK